MATLKLERSITDCRTRGLKKKTINNHLEVVRRLLSLAARKWRDEHGLNWLETATLISYLEVDDAPSPYPSNWDEQRPLFKVNTGTREQAVCRLCWDWETDVPELGTSVFLIPSRVVKNKDDSLVLLNAAARSVIDAQRGKHPAFVFNYRGKPVTKMYDSGWRRARGCHWTRAKCCSGIVTATSRRTTRRPRSRSCWRP